MVLSEIELEVSHALEVGAFEGQRLRAHAVGGHRQHGFGGTNDRGPQTGGPYASWDGILVSTFAGISSDGRRLECRLGGPHRLVHPAQVPECNLVWVP